METGREVSMRQGQPDDLRLRCDLLLPPIVLRLVWLCQSFLQATYLHSNSYKSLAEDSKAAETPFELMKVSFFLPGKDKEVQTFL